VHDEPTLRLGSPAEQNLMPPDAPSGEPYWVLVVDDARQPRGWVDARRVAGGRPVGLADLVLGGSLVGPQSSLRTALDAALSSPSGRGVAIDADGRVIGTVAARDVLDAIEAARLASGAAPDQPAITAAGVRPYTDQAIAAVPL
jgi:osmoprotectant transport system ATP-binding protein